MQKNVLLIESDTPFARAMSKALESRGYGVRTSPDGKEGFELARALHPDCVVLCVELPGLSGYSWCNRLKKDGDLKSIPLVITSSEATPETFDQHRKLKTRAEDYLLKPFPPETLVERVATLVGLPDVAPPEDELITMDDVELEGAPAGGGGPAAEEDADLKLLDDAFDNISRGGDEPGSGAPASEPPLTLMPDTDESPALSDFDREMAAALASLAEEAAEASKVDPFAPSPRKVEPRVESVAQDETPILLEDVEILPLVDEGTAAALQAAEQAAAALRGELAAMTEEADRLREEAARFRGEGVEAQRLLALRVGEAAEMQARFQTSVEKASRDEARSAELEGELAQVRSKLSAAEMSATARGAELVDAERRTEEVEREIETVRAEAERLRAESEGLRGEAEGLRAEVQSLRSSADGVRGEAAGLRNEIATLGATVEGLRGEAERSRGDSEILRAEADGLRAEGESLRAEVASLRAEADGLRAEGESLRAEVATMRAEGESLRTEVASTRAEADGLRAEVASLRADGETLRAEVATVRADADARGSEAASFRSEAASFRSEAEASRAAAEAFRAEAEARATEQARHIQELEGRAAQHEERVLRAYQKIKSDEKLRDKTRKALAMVLQILEERPGGDGGSPPAAS